MRDNRLLPAIPFLIGVAYLYFTERLPSVAFSDPIGVKAFPRLLGVLLVIASLLWFAEILRAARSLGDEDETIAPAHDRAKAWVSVAAVTAWTFVYFVAFEPLGFVVSSVLFLLPLVWWFHQGHWAIKLAVPVLFSLTAYFMLSNLLGADLPKGSLLPLLTIGG